MGRKAPHHDHPAHTRPSSRNHKGATLPIELHGGIALALAADYLPHIAAIEAAAGGDY